MAVGASLAVAPSLGQAVVALGFVQYDPIRHPARAQDLILHQRIDGYVAGALEREYPELGLEEDHLHAYGAMPHQVMCLLHPRSDRRRPGRPYVPAGLAADVLDLVRAEGPVHPRDVERKFVRGRAVNDWGGFSAATTRALEELHYHGLVRVARRDNGVRVYEARALPPPLAPETRLRRLTLLIARLLAPVPEATLNSTVARLNDCGRTASRRTVIAELVGSGDLAAGAVDGIRYVWPPDLAETPPSEDPPRTRFLAPFDPVVWDRRRFEQLWGWRYRFEAYTPSAKRQFGYYALPVLWGDAAIGWVNCRVDGGGLDVELEFSGRRITGRAFREAFDREVVRLEAMLRVLPREHPNRPSVPSDGDPMRG
jgi:uncharacterized protein